MSKFSLDVAKYDYGKNFMFNTMTGKSRGYKNEQWIQGHLKTKKCERLRYENIKN